MARMMLALLLVGISLLGGGSREGSKAPGTRARLAAHRQQQIARLHAYAAAGKFPRNYFSPLPLHMFKDADGRLCAVANLVHQDGLDSLVDATARTHNDVVLAEVSGGPLHDWALESGLTIEEIARIQVPAGRIGFPIAESQMVAGLREHFGEVERELAANSEKSLDLAVAREEAAQAPAPMVAVATIW